MLKTKSTAKPTTKRTIRPTIAPTTKKPIAIVTKAPVQLETIAPKALPVFKPVETKAPVEEQLVLSEPVLNSARNGPVELNGPILSSAAPHTGGWVRPKLAAKCPTKEQFCADAAAGKPSQYIHGCELFECTLEIAEPTARYAPTSLDVRPGQPYRCAW